MLRSSNPAQAHRVHQRKRGFLPADDPLGALSSEFEVWDRLGQDLSHLLSARQARRAIEAMPVLDARSITDLREAERAMMLLSVFGHAAVWESWRDAPAPSVPRSVAIPWSLLAARLGRPPSLAYASHGLHNWRRLDPTGAVTLGNLTVLQNFLGGLDEDWFILVHVDIEARAAPILTSVAEGQSGVEANRHDQVAHCLQATAAAQREMLASLQRMRENCDPYIFYQRVQPFMHGFQRHPVIYEGVVQYGGCPQNFAGASAAQSAIVPLLDAALGVSHVRDDLSVYLEALRDYMPPDDRQLLLEVARGPSIRQLVLTEGQDNARLVELYNECIEQLARFREAHLALAAEYIQLQAHRDSRGERGTGGTPFMQYLTKHIHETREHFIPD